MRATRSLLLGALALTVLGAAVVSYLVSSGVEVVIDDEVRSIRTFADDVATILARLDVEVGPDDRVEPALDTPVTDGLRVVVRHAKTVEVHVEDRAPRTVTAVVDTVADVLREGDLADLLEREARIDPAPDARVVDGDRIVVDLPVAVVVAVDGIERPLESYATTVAGALGDAGVALAAHDLVDPPRNGALEPNTVVTVRRVEMIEDVVDVPVARKVQRHETDDLLAGHTRVETEGEDGRRQRIYAVTLIDGQEAKRELVGDELVREPTDRVVLVGAGSEQVHEAQQLLTDLGYPAGPVDGVDGPQTRRALCAWRRLQGHEATRDPLQAGELDALRETSGLPAAAFADRGVTVDRTCQALYYGQDGRWQRVHAASTGADGLPRPDSYRIQRKREGWHTSTLFPAPRPNMYNSMYIRGAIAIHGSNHVPPQPASAGCVRVTPQVADQLFADLSVGARVEVIGSY